MRNNFLKFFLVFYLLNNFSNAEEFKFKTKEIELINGGDIIYATDGTATSFDGNLEIKANKFEYKKDLGLLKAYNGIAYFKSENLEIEFGEIDSNETTLITTAKKNVKITDLKKNLIIKTDLISYKKKNKILESPLSSTLVDKFNNILTSSYFSYNIDSGILKMKDANLQDVNKNIYKIKLAYLNTNSEKLIGKDINVELNNSNQNNSNQPRLKGRSIIHDKNSSEITKGVFTTCKKRDGCPPWQLSAEKIRHDTNNQTINYKNAILRVYDVPVMYFPKFFHPDPTVKRKSGFLIPSLKNSPDSDSFLSVPYFAVISQNKDMTLTPRFFSDNKFLVQSEYRQKNKDSNHIADMSMLSETNTSSKTHFFYRYNKLLDLANFEDGNFSLKIEKTSNDTYLRKNKLKSPIIDANNVLQSNLKLALYSDSLSVDTEVKVFENLDVGNNNDKYEFVLPKIDIIKRLENKSNLNGNFFIKSNNFIRNYKTNILEKINVNNLIFNSSPKITNIGFYNNYDFMIKNVNSDSKNSDNYQNEDNYYLSGLFQFNSSLPLVKKNENLLKIIKPKIALKISPNDTKDLSKTEGNRLDVNNIYNFNRLSKIDTVEGGNSLTLGNDYTIFNEKKSKEIFSLKIANNLRLEENNDLPRNNQLGAKTSNFFGEIMISPLDFFTAKYNTSTKNNLTDINYENLTTEIKVNNFVTTFDYLNENNTNTKNSYLMNTTKYSFNKSNSILFSTRENKTSNLTEYYNLVYEYKHDCLAASVEYNKDYYDDRDIKPTENILFKLSIVPFGKTSSPNLKN